MPSAPPVVMTFAASDPTGGAGLQADLLTIAALGCHPLSVLTALTAQDTRGVDALQAIDADWVAKQARVAIADIAVDAFKLGVLGSASNVRVIAEFVASHPGVPLVLDPVLASTRGEALAAPEVVDALLATIVPRATVATPNRAEAERLGGAPRLLALGCRYVLVTGGDAPGDEVVNTLYDAGGVVREDRWQRLPGGYHGSGCTLASAIAAALAHGRAPAQAVGEAQAYTWQALAGGFRLGAGQAIPKRAARQ